MAEQAPYQREPRKKWLVDSFSKKDCSVVNAPAMFNIRNIGKTSHENSRNQIASEGLRGFVFEVSLPDLQNEFLFSKFKLITEDVHGKNCWTYFCGMKPMTKCASW